MYKSLVPEVVHLMLVEHHHLISVYIQKNPIILYCITEYLLLLVFFLSNDQHQC